MALSKEKKQNILKDLKEKIEKQKSIAFVDFKGLKVKSLSLLRKKIKEAGGNFQVAKKTLIRLALEKFNLRLDKELEGEIALIFAFEDPISPLKEAFKFSQTNANIKFLAGFFEGKFIGKEEVLSLAQLPSKDELLTKLVWTIQSPISGLVNVLQGNLRNLVYVLSQISPKVNQ